MTRTDRRQPTFIYKLEMTLRISNNTNNNNNQYHAIVISFGVNNAGFPIVSNFITLKL